jgi:hypothetical protein
MGFSQRIFFVNEDDSLLRLPLTRYERLLQRDPEERFPQYAGKRIRYILAVVDLLNRRPVEILRVKYSHLYFDSDGLIEPDKRSKEIRRYFDIFPSEPIIRYPWDPVRPKRTLPEKSYRGEYNWTPTAEIENAILKSVFESD